MSALAFVPKNEDWRNGIHNHLIEEQQYHLKIDESGELAACPPPVRYEPLYIYPPHLRSSLESKSLFASWSDKIFQNFKEKTALKDNNNDWRKDVHAQLLKQEKLKRFENGNKKIIYHRPKPVYRALTPLQQSSKSSCNSSWNERIFKDFKQKILSDS